MLLSMMYRQTVCMSGYKYPVPSVPFIEGSTSDSPTYEYDNYNDYDPNDVPPDQAAPEPGYSYPVPANPLTLPAPDTTPRPTEALPGYQKNPEPTGYSYPIPENPLGICTFLF